MILSRAWLHDTVSCAAWNDARKGVYLKPLFKTPCSNCYWGWSKPIMLDYRDISLMESVPLLRRTVTASPVGIEPMTILEGGPPPYNWYLIHNVENSTFCTGWPPNTPYDCAEARRTQVADATFRDKLCVSKFCVDKLCVSTCGTSCVWTSCVCVSKVCVDKFCVDKLCVWVSVDKLCVDKLCVRKLCVCCGGGRRREEGRRRRECRTKNKNHTQRCGEKSVFKKYLRSPTSMRLPVSRKWGRKPRKIKTEICELYI